MNLFVIGVGYVGFSLAVNAAKNGYHVTAYDISEAKIENYKNGICDSDLVSEKELIDLQLKGSLVFTNKLIKIVGDSIFVISVPTPLNIDRNPDVSILEHACAYIADFVGENDLIINESTSYIGTLRNLIIPIITKKSGKNNLMFAAAPERIDPGNSKWNMKNTPRIVAGINKKSLRQAVNFYSKLCDEIHEVSTPEVAEAAKLFENSFRQVNIALVNELAQIANKLSFSTHEAIMAAATKPFGFMPFYPSIGVGGHCIPVDPSYLSFSAELVGVDAKFIKLANQVNSSMPNIIKERVREYLGGDITGMQVQIAGITYKSNISDLRESPALDLILELENAGAIVSWHDPFVDEYNGKRCVPLSSEIDLGLIVTPHSQIDFAIWKKTNVKVLDLSANSNDYGWPKFL